MLRNLLDSCSSFLARTAGSHREMNRSRARRRHGRSHLDSSGISGVAGMETLEPRYALAGQAVVQRLFVDVVPGNATTTETIAIGGARANAVNTLGDHDWYRVSLVAGTRYQFNLNATTNVIGTPALGDPYLYLRFSSGYIVDSDDDSGGSQNSKITFTATSSGTYFLDAGAYLNSSTGGYTLYARSLGTVDDYAGNASTIGSVSVGGSTTGVINTSGDSDWFRVYLTGGRTYRFDLTRNTLSDPYLRLRNGFGTVLTFNDDSGGTPDSRISYRPTTSGWYYLDAQDYGSNTGSYTLRATRLT